MSWKEIITATYWVLFHFSSFCVLWWDFIFAFFSINVQTMDYLQKLLSLFMDTTMAIFISLWIMNAPAVQEERLSIGNWGMKNIEKSSNNQKKKQKTFPIKNRLKFSFFYHKFPTKFFHTNFSHISSRVLKLPLLLFIDKVFPAPQFSISNTVGKFIIVLLFFTWKINHKVWFQEKWNKKKFTLLIIISKLHKTYSFNFKERGWKMNNIHNMYLFHE